MESHPLSRRKNLARRLALGAAALALSLALLELGLRALGGDTLHVNPDQRRFWIHDPQLGWRSRPGQAGRFQTEFFDVYVSINSRGLRDHESPLAKPDGVRRVLVIGDSFAWGFGVEQEEIFSALLEGAIPATEVINGAVSGYSSDQALLWLREEGLRYGPDVVVYSLSGNDDVLNHMRRVYWIYSKPSFRLAAGQLALQGVPVPRPSPVARVRHWLRAHSVLTSAIESQLVTPTDLFLALAGDMPDARDPHRLTLALVDAMREAAHSRGASFLLLANPDFWFSPWGSWERLISELRGSGHEVIEVVTANGWDAPAMQIPGDGHWNARGHEFVARLLEPRVREERARAPLAAADQATGDTDTGIPFSTALPDSASSGAGSVSRFELTPGLRAATDRRVPGRSWP